MVASGDNSNSFLPMTRVELEGRGWEELDILLISGDAYVDHPSFGVALLGRWLEDHGYRVGVVAQPRWDTPEDIARLGRPRLFAGVTAGALDSMLAHYTAFRKLRHDDAYTPGGKHGARPNRASIVYTNLVRQAFPGLPVVVGGIEASLRRITHYDFWSDKMRRSLLLDSKADVLVYGMAERAILEIAQRLEHVPPQAAAPAKALAGIAGTCFAGRGGIPEDATVRTLASHESIVDDPRLLMETTLAMEHQVHDGAWWAVQAAGGRDIVVAPPAAPLTSRELDNLYDLPFQRRPHPLYRDPIPAATMIQFSVTSHRGCGGGCSFCSLALHQGRRVRSRGADSLLREVKVLTQHPNWKGSISDIGGPTANMLGAVCMREQKGLPACKRSSCLTPGRCPDFKLNQTGLLRLLQKIDALPGVKHLRVASGIRHDIALDSPDYLWALVRHYVGGQLKLAPEHCCDHVLELMRKPSFKIFEQFLTLFERESQRGGKEQYIVPYLLSAFPGCTDDDMRQLARWLRQRGWRPQQVQCFIPTPGTVATAMYAGGIDPAGKRITVARSDAARLRQHRILMPDGEPRGQRKKSCWQPVQTGRGGKKDSDTTRGARSHRRKKK